MCVFVVKDLELWGSLIRESLQAGSDNAQAVGNCMQGVICLNKALFRDGQVSSVSARARCCVT